MLLNAPKAVSPWRIWKGLRGRVRANKKQRRGLHGWSFAKLQGFIEKAEKTHGFSRGMNRQ